MYKAIIFDLDGVICFTDEYHYQAWKAIADQLHIYFDREINDRLRGVSRMESLDIILERSNRKYTCQEKENLAEQKNKIYRELISQMTEQNLSDEVKETLKELQKAGLKLAIGSSSKNTKTILRQIGLSDFFDAVIDGTNISRSKPDPEVFLKAAALMKERPGDCLVVEDAVSGIEAAYRGGFQSAGWGEARKHAHVTYKLNCFSDLIKIV